MIVSILLFSLLAQPAAAAPAPPAATETPPPPRPTAWPFRMLSEDDYPAAALRGQQEGRVVYRITIGPEGRVSNCDVRISSGSQALDNATCRIVSRRARFTPARDSAGRPIPDTRDGDVLWLLPRGDEEN
jgi:protein TonB